MKIGADPKRLATLGGLVLVGGYLLWSNVFSSNTPSTSGSSAPQSTTPATGKSAGGSAATAALDRAQNDSSRLNARRQHASQRPEEFKPFIPSGAALDPTKVDPTLRLDLLAKVQQVQLGGAQRNLFQFGEAAKPPSAVAPPIKNPGKITISQQTGPVVPPGPPPTPTAPPITFKYYGYTNTKTSAQKRAFFLDGEDIIVAGEGEMIKKRYKLVKIGVNSATLEDTQFKSEQTLPLAQELG